MTDSELSVKQHGTFLFQYYFTGYEILSVEGLHLYAGLPNSALDATTHYYCGNVISLPNSSFPDLLKTIEEVW